MTNEEDKTDKSTDFDITKSKLLKKLIESYIVVKETENPLFSIEEEKEDH